MVTIDKSNTAREYLRVSLDSSGREKSPAEQHADNQRAADRNGWTLGESYKDIGSASRYARKARSGFDALIEDLERDRFGAQILILWESSRGTRRMSETVRLIELCEERSVLIYVTSDSKLYNPREPRDRRSLLEDGIDSEYESAKTSKRATRARAADAVAGRPNGPAPFGFKRVFDPATGRLDKQVPHETEAPVIEELFKRLHKGHSLRGIALNFAERGIYRRQRFDKETGEPLPLEAFTAQHLRALALNVAYAGQREHSPGRVARRKGEVTHHYEAMWPALVSKAAFLAVQARLNDPRRVTVRPGRGKHLLSLIPGVVCDVCGGALSAKRPDAPNAVYICHDGGHVSVPYNEFDAYIEAKLLGYLARPDNLERLSTADVDNDLEDIRSEVAHIRAEIAELAGKVTRGELGIEFASMVEPGLRARLRAAVERETRLPLATPLLGFVGPEGDVRAAWNDAPIAARRELVRFILQPHRLGEVRVIRSPVNRTRVPIEDRVQWRQV